jgi:hypothetical protein
MGARLYRLVSKPEGETYELLMTALLNCAATFGLVWPEQACLEASALEVRRDLQPLQLWQRKSDRWPGTRLIGHKTTIATYRADEAALAVLIRPGALFAWLRPRFPEDIWFVRADGSLAFASIIHEGDAWLFSRTVAALAGRHLTLELETRFSADDECFRPAG